MARNTPKQEVIVRDILWDLDEKTIDESIDYLTAIQTTYAKTHENIRLDRCWDGHNETFGLQVVGYPIKTEEEKQKELADKQAKAQKALDKLLLEAKENGFSLNIENKE